MEIKQRMQMEQWCCNQINVSFNDEVVIANICRIVNILDIK